MKILIFFLLLFSTETVFSQMAEWNSANSGRIQDINFQLVNLDSSVNKLYTLFDEDFFSNPFENNQVCQISSSDNWHLQFDKKVRCLHLYIGVWRVGVYKFSEPFRLINSSENVKRIDNYLIIEESSDPNVSNFGIGELEFHNPVCCLFVESSRPAPDSPHLMTFGVFRNYICLSGLSKFDRNNLKIDTNSVCDINDCVEISKYYPYKVPEY